MFFMLPIINVYVAHGFWDIEFSSGFLDIVKKIACLYIHFLDLKGVHIIVFFSSFTILCVKLLLPHGCGSSSSFLSSHKIHLSKKMLMLNCTVNPCLGLWMSACALWALCNIYAETCNAAPSAAPSILKKPDKKGGLCSYCYCNTFYNSTQYSYVCLCSILFFFPLLQKWACSV